MKQHILIISGNPVANSLCEQLADSYHNNCQAESKYFQLSCMDFDPNLAHGYHSEQTLEPDLLAFQAAISWAQHIVIIAPIWWGTVPAKLKGLIDRSLLPGFAFQYHENQKHPEQLLTDKTATLIFTLDTPPWYYRYVQGAPAIKQLNTATLGYCGIKTIQTHLWGPVISASHQTKQQWFTHIQKMASAHA